MAFNEKAQAGYRKSEQEFVVKGKYWALYTEHRRMIEIHHVRKLSAATTIASTPVVIVGCITGAK